MINIDKNKIAIVTTVSNFNLYKKTATLFPKGIDKIVIDGTKGLYGLNSIEYMFKVLKKSNYDWIIMADEDVFFKDAESVFELIDYMNSNNLHVSGVRDGGVIKHRFHNPNSINTFFSVLNFGKIKQHFDINEIRKHQRIFPEIIVDPITLSSFKYNYDLNNLKEPYYCFYFWLRLNKFNFLYLDTNNPVGKDEVANEVLSHKGEIIAMHSWYARAYEVYDDQTNRINEFIKYFNIIDEISLKEVIIYKKRLHSWKSTILKNIKSVLKR